MSNFDELKKIQDEVKRVFPGAEVVDEWLIEPEVEQISLFDLRPERVLELKKRKPKASSKHTK